jgi:hypothetical protein
MGPVAQDFRATFQLGSSDKRIATVDVDGVVLAAIQGLHGRLIEELAERDRRIADLEKRLSQLTRAIGVRETRMVMEEHDRPNF